MHKSDHQRFSYAATDHDAVSRFLHNISLCKDWILGECVVKEQESPLAIYQATNRDGYPFLLYVSPIRTWGREERIHQHVIRVNRALAQGSFRYNACEPMIQQPTWIRSGDFFFGITPDRGLQSIFKMAPFHNRSSFILNTIHITALFRFLECDIWPFTREAESSEDLLVKATALYDKVAPRLHNASEIPRRWGHFYRHNAETAARTHDFTPVYTVGDFLRMFAYCPERETLYLEGAFPFLRVHAATISAIFYICLGSSLQKTSSTLLISFPFECAESFYVSSISICHLLNRSPTVPSGQERIDRSR